MVTEAAKATVERLTVPIDDLVPNEHNPNVMDERTYQAARESIREYGFIDPVLVRIHPRRKGKYEIIDGEHRWKGAKDEGLTEVLADSLGKLPDAAAKKLTIILNETRGEADIVKLGRLLADIQKEVDGDTDKLMLGLPYTNDELDHLLSIGEVDWSDFKPGGNDDGAGEGRGNGAAHTVTLGFDDHAFERWTTFAGMLTHDSGKEIEFVVIEAMKEAAAKL